MTPLCITAVQAAARKPLTPAKIKKIDERVRAMGAELARRDQARWLGLTRDQQITEASIAAMKAIEDEAALKQYRGFLQVLRTREVQASIPEHMRVNNLTRSQGYIRHQELTAMEIDGIRSRAISQLGDFMDAAADKDGTGLLRRLGMAVFNLDNPQMTADIVREVFLNASGGTGNKAAKAAARAWLDTIERLRRRFNSAGGDIGKLAYGYLSQAHDAARVLDAGANSWVDNIMAKQLLDRTQYVRDDGRTMNDTEVRAMLHSAWKTISSEGDNKRRPGAYQGEGARATHGSDHRVLHFKDGDAWMAYMGDYGQGSLYDAMLSHISGMARDIGLVERYGPNPQQQHRLQSDLATRADGEGTKANRAAGNTPEAYWNLINGHTSTPANPFIANLGADLRNIQTAAKLGGAVLSSMTDVATIGATLHFNKLPWFQMLGNVARQLGDADTRAFLVSHGVIAESLSSTLNRFTGDHLTHSLTGRVAQSVMKLSFMNAWSDGLRAAFSQTMMHGLSRMARKDWTQLDEWDRYLLQRKGITQADWSVVRQAKPTDFKGRDYMTPDAIRATGAADAERIATRVLGWVNDEAQFAVVNPDLATRAIVTGGGMPAGTLAGEAARSFYQFKSFPIAMLTRHWRRVLETPQGLEGAPTGFGAQTAAGGTVNKIATLAALNVSMMMLGAMVLQTKTMLSGKDPFDMTEGKFWMRALGQGGGLGYLGDLIAKDPTEHRGNTVEQLVGSVAGPVAGSVFGLVGDIGAANIWQAAKGEKTDIAAEALKWGNSQLPGQSLWQIRGLWEHAFLQNAQEALNPGYLRKMEKRALKDWNQRYYWKPGDPLPSRMPAFEHAIGQ